MLYLTWGWRYKVTGSVYPAFASIQPQGRALSLCPCYRLLVVNKSTKSCSNLGDVLINCDTPPVHLCYSPSLSVTLMAFTQSYTLSHCLWSSAPLGRLASLPNHNLLILAELIFQKAQPIVCTLPTRSSGMSVDLILWHRRSCTRFLFRMAHSCTTVLLTF